MRVLVTWGSKRGGTEGIGRIVAETLRAEGFDVDDAPVDEIGSVGAYDAAIVGGALYASRWTTSARRFVRRNARALRRMPVWFFSSGPLDDTADRSPIPATNEVAVFGERVGIVGHVTFGGRLAPDATGFPASAMAKEHAGDWRNPERIRAWATDLAEALPHAVPGTPVDHTGGSSWRLLAHGVAGWAACAALMGALMSTATLGVALTLHAVAAPLVFVGVGWHYFRARGARAPLPTAVAFVAIVAGLDLAVVAGLVQGSLAMFTSVAGTWLPFALILLATWVTGEVVAYLPARADAAATLGGDERHPAGRDAAPAREPGA
ncbi:MAG: flavodoxin domain-containing protein [Sandaracinaceae bacterium]